MLTLAKVMTSGLDDLSSMSGTSGGSSPVSIPERFMNTNGLFDHITTTEAKMFNHNFINDVIVVAVAT